VKGLFLLAKLLGKMRNNLIGFYSNKVGEFNMVFKVGVVHGVKFLIRHRLVKSFLRMLLLSFFSKNEYLFLG